MQNHSQFTSYQQILSERQGRGFTEAEVAETLYPVLNQLVKWHDQNQAYGFISLETIAYDHGASQVVLLQGNQFVNGYVAPEVSQSGQTTPTGDMYALGVVIAVLLTGQSPQTLRNLDGSWNWSDRCVISDQFEQILNLALADHAAYRYVNSRQMLAALFPNLQIPIAEISITSTTIVANQQSGSPKSASLGLAIGACITAFFALLGFGISKLMVSQNNPVANNINTIPSPIITTSVAIAPPTISLTPTSIQSPTPSQSPSAPPISTNPFESSKFPQPACGDPPPSDNGSSISLYPVFVEYSDRNLQQIQSQFCLDAISKVRKDTNRQAVQVASFTSRDRAVLFADFLSKRVKGVDIGEPTILPSSLSGRVNSKVVSSDQISFANGANNAIVTGNI